MRIIKEQAVEVFGQIMIAQLVEYDVDVSNLTAGWKINMPKEYTTITKLKFKDKFVFQEKHDE